MNACRIKLKYKRTAKHAFHSFLLVLLYFTLSLTSSASVITLNKNEDSYELSSQASVFEDPSSALTIEHILSGNTQFKHIAQSRLDFGVSESTYWLRIDLRNNSEVKDWILEIDYRLLETITLYKPDKNGGFIKKQSGLSTPFAQREIKSANPAFLLHLDSSEVIFLSCSGRLPLQIPLHLHKREAFAEKQTFQMAVFAVYYSFVLLMIILNLISYFILRDKIFRMYSMALALIALGLATDNGLGFKFLWPQVPFLNVYANSITGGLAGFFMMGFIRNLLLSRAYSPLGDKVTRVLQWTILGAGPVLCWINPGMAFTLTSVLTLAELPVAAFLGIKAVSARYRPAVYYMIGFTGLATGVVLYILGLLNVIPANAGALGIYVGSVIEMIFFMISVTIGFKTSREREKLFSKKLEEYQLTSKTVNENKKETAPDTVSALTEREKEVLAHIALGMTDKEIAERLFISLTTVKAHARNIYSKLNVKNRTEAVAVSGRYSLDSLQELKSKNAS